MREDFMMDVQVVHHEGISLIALSGELDLHTQELLRLQVENLVLDELGPRVYLDLAGLRFMDSSGARQLWNIKRRLDRAGREVVVTRTSPPVRRLYEILQRAGLQLSA